MVKDNAVLADIGTDHGFIPVKLVDEGRIQKAIACDLHSDPLERARAHIQEYGLENQIETRLSDGLCEIVAGEVDTVLIAGMGGELIVRILEERKDLKEGIKEYILSPHSEWSLVRKYLWANGYSIVEEEMLCEDHKYYIILRVLPEQDMREKTEIYALFGEDLIQKNHPVLREYLLKEKKKFVQILSGLEDGGEKLNQRRQEITHYISCVEEAEHEMQGNTRKFK